MTRIARRDFLRVAPAAAGAAYAAATNVGARPDAGPQQNGGADARNPATTYTPKQDYPIQPVRYSDVKITDDFWKPKITTNAKVTIPFEVKKLSATARGFVRQRPGSCDPLPEDTPGCRGCQRRWMRASRR